MSDVLGVGGFAEGPSGLAEKLTTLVVVSERELRSPRVADFGPNVLLRQDLYRRFGVVGRLVRRLRYEWTRAGWMAGIAGSAAAKRVLDIVVACGLLAATLPIMAVTALLIKLRDGGPAIFWQTRLGRWGRPFAFPKFRSMVMDAEALKESLLLLNDHGASVTFKMRRDPRITWIGHFIRKTSIDELPQLWCVLRGDMSLVGPRPPTVEEVEQYSLNDRRRLEATPGLTCIWQVSGRSDIGFSRHVEMDIEYIESQSLALDLKLLLQTVPAVLLGRGAY